MYGMFEMIFKDCIKAFESEENEFCKNQKHKRKPVLLSGKK